MRLAASQLQPAVQWKLISCRAPADIQQQSLQMQRKSCQNTLQLEAACRLTKAACRLRLTRTQRWLLHLRQISCRLLLTALSRAPDLPRQLHRYVARCLLCITHTASDSLSWQGPLDEAGLRYQRAQQAVHALVAAAGPAQAPEALQTLAQVLQNALSSQEDKFRRLREQNPAFHRRAGQWPAAGEVLQAAGFVRQAAGEPMWVLQRNDPGLLWLALSAVQEGLQSS